MKYRKRPVIVEATRWNVPDENGKVLLARDCKDHPAVRPASYMEVSTLEGTNGCSKQPPYWGWEVLGIIDTLEGKHLVCPGDYIINGIKGEFYLCKPDIFEMTYEPVKNEVEEDEVTGKDKNIRTIHPIDTKNQLTLSLLKFMSEVGKETKKRGGNSQ